MCVGCICCLLNKAEIFEKAIKQTPMHMQKLLTENLSLQT